MVFADVGGHVVAVLVRLAATTLLGIVVGGVAIVDIGVAAPIVAVSAIIASTVAAPVIWIAAHIAEAALGEVTFIKFWNGTGRAGGAEKDLSEAGDEEERDGLLGHFVGFGTWLLLLLVCE